MSAIKCSAAVSRATSSTFKTVAPRRAVSCRVASHEVTLKTPTGQQSFKCQADKSLLEGALAAGVEVPHLCQTGTCGVCAARVLAGNVERADFLLDDAQQEYGFALLCTTKPTSDVTLATQQEKELHTIPYGL